MRRAGVDGEVENQAYWGLGGSYSDWLEGWLGEFGGDLRVVFFDDIVADSWNVMSGVFDWLGLDPERAEAEGLGAANKTEQYRNRTAQRVALAVNRRGERVFRSSRTSSGRCSGLLRSQQGRPSRRHEPAARERLDRFYRRTTPAWPLNSCGSDLSCPRAGWFQPGSGRSRRLTSRERRQWRCLDHSTGERSHRSPSLTRRTPMPPREQRQRRPPTCVDPSLLPRRPFASPAAYPGHRHSDPDAG
jgi:hypothetical protein